MFKSLIISAILLAAFQTHAGPPKPAPKSCSYKGQATIAHGGSLNVYSSAWGEKKTPCAGKMYRVGCNNGTLTGNKDGGFLKCTNR
jgi:hypothetical protein